MRRKAVQDQDEGGREPSASGWPLTSLPESSRLPLKQRSIYPTSKLPSIAGSDVPRFPWRTAEDVSILPRDMGTLGHLRSSMGRLNLQGSEGLVRTPRQANGQNTLEEDLEVSSISSGTTSSSDGSIGSYPPAETRSPLSIRSYIAAQLKVSDQDRNSMRVRRSQESGRPEASKNRESKRTRPGDIGHYSPTIPKRMGDSEVFSERGKMISHVQQCKQRPEFGRPTPSSRYDEALIHHQCSSSRVLAILSIVVHRRHAET